MKTYSAKSSDVERAWHLVDLDGLTVGRAATKIATILRGKHKPTYTPHVDTGDYVVCINAEKVVFTGNKLNDKKYYRYSGFIGGLKERTATELLALYPEDVITFAVKGMLPKNALGRQMITKLKVHTGPEHTHAGQNPQPLDLNA
jgi:large subunit ribosomal protein L13